MKRSYWHTILVCLIPVSVLITACGSDEEPSAPQPSGYSVSGSVVSGFGSPTVEGLSVNIGTKSASTNDDGNFTVPGLVSGTYVVRITGSGVKIAPDSMVITIADSNVTGLQFTASATPGNGSVLMVPIEPGSFLYVSDIDDMYGHEFGPRMRVTITKGIWVGVTEVTAGLFQDVMGFDPSENPQGPDAAVHNATFTQIIEFCNKISERDGFEKPYTISDTGVSWNPQANGYRLPTNAEWEYFARAGTETDVYTGNLSDPTKDTMLNEIAWYSQNCGREKGLSLRDFFKQLYVRPVGQKKPNPWGLYDVIGNVSEITIDAYFNSDRVDNSIDPVGVINRRGFFHRGGAVSAMAISCNAYFYESVQFDREEMRTERIPWRGVRLVRNR